MQVGLVNIRNVTGEMSEKIITEKLAWMVWGCVKGWIYKSVLRITVSDPRDRFVYPSLTRM